MAYMNVEKKNKLAPGIKKVLAEYGMKGTLAKDRFTLKVNLKSGPIDFGTILSTNIISTDISLVLPKSFC